MIVVDLLFCFFFNDTATTEIYTLSLHDALPISQPRVPLKLCLIDGNILFALDFQAVCIAAEIDCKSAAALRLAADRAKAVIKRIGMRRVERELHRAAMAGSIEFHLFFLRCISGGACSPVLYFFRKGVILRQAIGNVVIILLVGDEDVADGFEAGVPVEAAGEDAKVAFVF